mgnify:CR=1 FL=1
MDRSMTAHDSSLSTGPRPGWAMVLVLASALVAFSIGCDSGTQEPDAPEMPAPETSTSTPDAAAAAPAPTPADGSIAPERFPTELPEGMAAEIPSNLPASIPIYPGSQPAQGRGGERSDGLDVAGVQLLSNDAVPEVFTYYEGELKANGWEITEANNDGIMASITATNGNTKAALFIATSPKGGTDIFVLSEN